ncbi:phosphatidylglycerophosphatase B [Sodalis sp. dw_96]|uniref:phosphatidylglycerophosphatase B n=1 Tax=Sodalis sp. dw_96 TaxID=2719794 RepID=UPI001BD46493|nr:phosphatidylglycerophosphatase B [Sodalis sp. dw_96]
MFDIAKRTGFGAIVLMVIPILAWVSGWQWHPNDEAWWWRVLFWITQTVSSPWGFITSAVLFGWFLWCLRFRWRPALVLACILGIALLAGQGIKSAIKDRVREPRPYVMWLEQTHDMNGQAFYSLPGKARSMLVKKELQNEQEIPRWLRKHWQHDTGFAFPSGHTVFAASWALLAWGLLWPRRHYKSVIAIMVWSVAVLSSRMVLGMHWPRDVVMGIFLSWLVIALACWLVQRWIGPLVPKPDEARDIKSRI